MSVVFSMMEYFPNHSSTHLEAMQIWLFIHVSVKTYTLQGF
ncbi:hypothetical protein [Candidatus Synechococcus calcipolaris]|nr:hypothetical protein [Candidatus Synechococcus calcipolaris]